MKQQKYQPSQKNSNPFKNVRLKSSDYLKVMY